MEYIYGAWAHLIKMREDMRKTYLNIICCNRKSTP